MSIKTSHESSNQSGFIVVNGCRKQNTQLYFSKPHAYENEIFILLFFQFPTPFFLKYYYIQLANLKKQSRLKHQKSFATHSSYSYIPDSILDMI